MPRIEARNIEEHVRKQTNRILDEAIRIFRKRGYQGTDMGQIAQAVGLARNSLYRYYPSKDSILLACLERDMQPAMERLARLKDQVTDPRERINSWLELQMDIAGGTCHEFMPMVQDIRRNSPELSSRILTLHEATEEILEEAVREVLQGSDRPAHQVSNMIGAMMRTTAAHVLNSRKREVSMQELKDSVARVLEID